MNLIQNKHISQLHVDYNDFSYQTQIQQKSVPEHRIPRPPPQICFWMCAPVHFNIKQRSSPKNVLINVRHRVMAFILLRHYRKGRFTLHNICLKLSHATCLQLELYCVTQAHNSPTTTWTSCFTMLMKTGLNNILLPILSWLLTVLFSQTMLNNIVNNQEQ